MKCRVLGHLLLVTTLYMLASCAGIKNEVTSDSYSRNGNEKGVVIMSINWGRKWGCGAFENAQLISFAFDLFKLQKAGDNDPPDLILNTPGRLMVDPVFLHYALLVDPGEYALSAFKIKVARSVSEVGYFGAQRSDLIKEGQPVGGTFKVEAGETVYVGHFFLDCGYTPTLWRYYTEDRKAFNDYMSEIKKRYPFLDLNKAQFRLFTGPFGSYESLEYPFAKYHETGLKAESARDYKTAEQNYEQALINARSGHAPDWVVSMTTYNLGRIKGYVCRDKDAEELLLEALKLEEKVSGSESGIATMRIFELARFYYDHRLYDKAIPFYKRGVEAVKNLGVESDDPIALANAIEEYSKALDSVGRSDDAKTAKQQADILRARNPGKKANFVPVRYNQSCSG